MVRQEKTKIDKRVPLFTLVTGAIAAAVYLCPGLISFLEYDRAAIRDGHIWRLLSGNLVHYSRDHLLFNLTVFIVVGWVIEKRGYPGFRSLVVVSGALTGMALFFVAPEIHAYGGLSGVAIAMCAYLGLHGLFRKEPGQVMCGALLVLVVAKIICEYRRGIFFFVSGGEAPFLPVPLAHLVGFVSALALFGVTFLRERARGGLRP